MSFESPTQFAKPYEALDTEREETSESFETVHHEIGFESISREDVHILRESAHTIFYEAMLCEAAAQEDQYARISLDGVRPDEFFDSLDSSMSRLKVVTDEYLYDGEIMSEERYNEMVDLYERIRDSRDHVMAAYAESVEGLVQPEAQESTVPAQEVREAPSVPAVVSIEAGKDENANDTPVAEVVAPKNEKADTEAVSQLQERAGDLVEEVTWTRERLYALFPKQQRSPEALTLLKELGVSQKRAEQLKADIRDASDAERFEQLQDEIRKNVAAVDAGLQQLKATLGVEPVTKNAGKTEPEEPVIPTDDVERYEPEPVSKTEPAEESEAPETPEAITPVEVNDKAVESEPAVTATKRIQKPAPSKNESGLREQISVMPDDADVARLMKMLNESQFYTDEERTTANVMYEAYQRSVAEGKPINIQRRNYQNLYEFVMNLAEAPSAEYVIDRADRIIDRMQAGASSADQSTLETAKAMRQMIDRIKGNPEKTETDVLQAYENLKRFARETESEWITIAGMHPPKAGPDGVFGARSLREGLMLIRDKHRAFHQSPRKRLLVDKMVRMLAYVPKEGLSSIDVDELTRLMREIDVPENILGNRASGSTEPASEGEIITAKKAKAETFDTDSSVTERKSRKLSITEDDGSQEESITVTVKTPVSEPTVEPKPEVVEGETAGISLEPDEQVPPEVVQKESAKTGRNKLVFPGTPSSKGVTVEESPSTSPETVGITVETLNEAPVASLSEEQDDNSALAAAEANDPINAAVPSPRPTVRSWQERREASSIVPMGPLKSEYPQFFAQVDVAEFDRVLRLEINAHERKYLDRIDEWLGVKRQSAFEYIKGMTLAELDALVQKTSAAERDRFLEETNVVYDSLIAWYDRISNMSTLVNADDHLTFGELFARSIIEEEIR